MLTSAGAEVTVIMTLFDERRDAFVNKFAQDETLRFKAISRRDKLLGAWAAERLGKTGPEAQAYVAQVLAAEFERAGHADVLHKVLADLDAAGCGVSEPEIHARMDDFLAKSVADISAGRL
jgi:hypothetical protein